MTFTPQHRAYTAGTHCNLGTEAGTLPPHPVSPSTALVTPDHRYCPLSAIQAPLLFCPSASLHTGFRTNLFMPLPCSEALYGSPLPRWKRSQHFSLAFIGFQNVAPAYFEHNHSLQCIFPSRQWSNRSSFVDPPFMCSFHVLKHTGPSTYNDLPRFTVPTFP